MSGVLKVIDDEIASLPKMADAIRFAGAKYGWGIDESEPVRRLQEARAAIAALIEAATDICYEVSDRSEGKRALINAIDLVKGEGK